MDLEKSEWATGDEDPNLVALHEDQENLLHEEIICLLCMFILALNFDLDPISETRHDAILEEIYWEQIKNQEKSLAHDDL